MRSVVLCILCIVTCVGCSRLSSETEEIGRSFHGLPIESVTLGNGAETLLIIATIHGNESAGPRLIDRLTTLLRIHPASMDGLRLVIVRVANPDGLAAHQRTNARGVDLNRNFPANNRREREAYGDHPLSEPESRALAALISRVKPTRILTMHQPLSCIDFDGPAEHIASHMAQWSELPLRKLGSRPGSLGAFAGTDSGIPIVTMELHPHDHQLSVRRLWSMHGPALASFLSYPGPPPASVFRDYSRLPAAGAAMVAFAALLAMLRHRCRRRCSLPTARHPLDLPPQ